MLRVGSETFLHSDGNYKIHGTIETVFQGEYSDQVEVVWVSTEIFKKEGDAERAAFHHLTERMKELLETPS